MPKNQKDNTTLLKKVALRRYGLKMLEAPIVMETHGGYGRVFEMCYYHLQSGIVFEVDDQKIMALADQRPTWAVYQADCVTAIGGGVGAHLAVNFLDVDPYGDPWPVIDAFFTSDRPRPKYMVVAVNDGIRQKLKVNGAWTCHSLQTMVDRHGNDGMYKNYLKVCEELISIKAAQVGYTLAAFTGYYCGYMQQMTHYMAVLRTTSSNAPSPA